MSDDPQNDDPLAALRRAPAPPDAAWDDLCRGALDEEGRAALLARPEAEALAPLFEPLGEAFAATLADRVLADRVLADRAPAQAGGARGPEAAPASPEARRGEVVPFPRRTLLSGAALVLALAAGLMLYAGRPPAALPAYTIEASAGDQAVRGDPVVGQRVSLGGRVVLVARPAVAVEGAVTVSARVLGEGGAVHPWEGSLEVSEGGAVRLTGVVGAEVRVPPGSYRVEVTIARAEGGDPTRLTVPLVVAP